MFNRLNRRRKMKLNNSGSTMMIVMVAVALIAVLATVLMSMSYMNYNMKVTELNSKKNFYTAEVVLDQISVGLQKEISDSVEDAYVRAMQRYTLENDIERNTNFANYYIGELRNRLRTASLDSKYQIEPIDTDGDGVYDCGLVHYLDSALQAAYANGNLKITSDEKKMESVAISKVDPESGAMVYESQGLVLYDLRIEYTDANKFTSVIETDIRLKTPSLTLVTKTAMPNVFDYSLVADAGILGGSTGTTVNFKGNVYAGDDTLNPAIDFGGISITQSHKWTFSGESRVVSAGPVSVAGGTTSLTTTEQTDCWFDSIKLNEVIGSNSGSISLEGNTYVRDDLTIEGNGGNVEISGNYYGFGYADTAEGSSAIVINGKNAVLDMSGLERLTLGGNAYIQTSKVEYTVDGLFDVDHNLDILTGNSLAVKSDQIAYLVPAECIGVNGTAVEIGRNPMTKAEYERWLNLETERTNGNASYANYQLVSFTKDTKTVGKTLGEYDINGSGYKTIFRTINGETLCYLYLDFTEEGAADYYKDYYYAAETKMNRYISAYNNRVLINPTMIERESKGTMLSYALDSDGGDISIVENTMDSSRAAEDIAAIEKEQDLNLARFDRLQAKLTLEENDVTAEELGRTVYENLINEAVLNSIPKNTTGEKKELVLSTGSIYAVFVNNRDKGPYYYTDEDVCVIVATGDVYLQKDFDGLLITDGKVILDGATQVVPNKEMVLKMLSAKESDAENAMSLIAKYFRNGDKYSFDTSLKAEVTNTMAGQQIGELIVYENWAKQ